MTTKCMQLLALFGLVMLVGCGTAAPPTQRLPAPPTVQIPAAPLSVYIAPNSNQTTNNELIALDASTGLERWRYKTGPAEVAPILKDGVLYLGSSDSSATRTGHGFFSAFRASDGRLLWQRELLPEITSLQVSAGIVSVSTEQHSTIASTAAFRASDGTLLWRFDQGILEALANGVAYIGGFPTISTGADQADLSAVNASDGSIRWQRQGNGPNHDTEWSVYPANGILYVIAGSISYGGPLPVTLLALNPSNGHQLWSHPSLGWFIAAEPQVAVVTGTSGGSPFSPLPPSRSMG